MAKKIERGELVLSVNRALLGAVSAHLRAVIASQRDDSIELHFYFDGTISDDDECAASTVGAEVQSDFTSLRVSEHLVQLDYPARLPLRDHVVFLRKERAA